MFIKELNDALKLIKEIFNVEEVNVVTDSEGDAALDLALKIGFDVKDHYVLMIIGWGFVKSIAFKWELEVKRFNFQYEKLTMLEAINKTATPLYSYCIENVAIEPKPRTSGSGVKSNKNPTTTTNSDWGEVMKDWVKSTTD